MSDLEPVNPLEADLEAFGVGGGVGHMIARKPRANNTAGSVSTTAMVSCWLFILLGISYLFAVFNLLVI